MSGFHGLTEEEARAVVREVAAQRKREKLAAMSPSQRQDYQEQQRAKGRARLEAQRARAAEDPEYREMLRSRQARYNNGLRSRIAAMDSDERATYQAQQKLNREAREQQLTPEQQLARLAQREAKLAMERAELEHLIQSNRS